MFYTGRPPPARRSGASRGPDPVRRTALPHELLVPRRRLAAGRPGRAGRRAGADRAGRHGPRRACTARSGSSARPRPWGCIRSSGSRSSCSTRPCADPGRVVIAAPATASARRPGAGRPGRVERCRSRASRTRPRPERPRLPGHREAVKEDLRGIGERARGPHLVLLARSAIGWRSLCRLVSRANMAGTKGVPRFSQALLAEHAEGLVALSGCRDGEIARRLRVGDRAGARAVAERYAGALRARRRPGEQRLLHRALAPPARRTTTGSWRRSARAGRGAGPAGRRHQRRPLRPPRGPRAGRRPDRDPPRPDARDARRPAPPRRRVVPEAGEELAALPPGRGAGEDPRTARAWAEGIATSAELAASCSVDLGFEQYRFPGFPVPDRETPFSLPLGAVLGGRAAPLPPDDARRS